MKLTDGLFHKVFDEVATEYPDIENEHWIVDIGAAKMADTPEAFDVIVVQNLYGDILSDVAAQIAGSVGLAGSANIGSQVSMFEAIHGSAPRRAGQNLANPSGLLMGAVQMLVHIGQGDVATKVHNAWLAHDRGRHPHLRHLRRVGVDPEGRHQRVRRRRDRADRASARRRSPPVEYRAGESISVEFAERPQGHQDPAGHRRLPGLDRRLTRRARRSCCCPTRATPWS